MEAAISVMQRYIELGHSLSCAYSGGKDSTCTLVLMLEAIRRVGGKTITHHVQSADTSIERRPADRVSNGRDGSSCRAEIETLPAATIDRGMATLLSCAPITDETFKECPFCAVNASWQCCR